MPVKKAYKSCREDFSDPRAEFSLTPFVVISFIASENESLGGLYFIE